jgi:hypothetical protein
LEGNTGIAAWISSKTVRSFGHAVVHDTARALLTRKPKTHRVAIRLEKEIRNAAALSRVQDQPTPATKKIAMPNVPAIAVLFAAPVLENCIRPVVRKIAYPRPKTIRPPRLNLNHASLLPR